MQLALDIALQDEVSLSNFNWHGNELLKQQLLLSLFDENVYEKRFFISGGDGFGKSHLLQALVYEFDKKNLPAIYLPLNQLHQYGPAPLDNIEQHPLICLDDIDAICGDSDWERAIFNLYNLVKEQNHALIISAKQPISALPIKLPDLKSRLIWEYVYRLNELDEQHKVEVLQNKAHHRGLNLSKQVAEYLLTHCNRNMSGLVKLLERLDKASLESKRKLTIPFIKDYLLSRVEF